MSYYDILQIPTDANIIDIKKQFRILATKYHPDNHNTGDAKLFSQVAQAYECLSNESKRNDYDKSLQIENTSKNANIDYINYKKSFNDFVSAQNIDTATFEIAKKQFHEHMNVYNASFIENTAVDINKRMADFEIEREQAELEFSSSMSKSQSKDSFNTIFDNKYKKKSNQIINIEEPLHFNNFNNNMLVYSSFNDEQNSEDVHLENYTSSINCMNNIYGNSNCYGDSIESQFETLKISKSKIDNEDIDKRIKEREAEDILFKNNKKFINN